MRFHFFGIDYFEASAACRFLCELFFFVFHDDFLFFGANAFRRGFLVIFRLQNRYRGKKPAFQPLLHRRLRDSLLRGSFLSRHFHISPIKSHAGFFSDAALPSFRAALNISADIFFDKNIAAPDAASDVFDEFIPIEGTEPG